MAKNKCIPCMGKDIKQVILEQIKDPVVAATLKIIPDCPESRAIELCGGKVKRGRSAWHEFVSACMKSKNIKGFGQAAPAMKECAKEWKQKK